MYEKKKKTPAHWLHYRCISDERFDLSSDQLRFRLGYHLAWIFWLCSNCTRIKTATDCYNTANSFQIFWSIFIKFLDFSLAPRNLQFIMKNIYWNSFKMLWALFYEAALFIFAILFLQFIVLHIFKMPHIVYHTYALISQFVFGMKTKVLVDVCFFRHFKRCACIWVGDENTISLNNFLYLMFDVRALRAHGWKVHLESLKIHNHHKSSNYWRFWRSPNKNTV